MRPVTEAHTELVVMVVLDPEVLLSPSKISEINAEVAREVVEREEHEPRIEHPRGLAPAVQEDYQGHEQEVGPDIRGTSAPEGE